MSPADYNLNLYRGDTGRWQIKLWADRDKTQPADLAGAKAEATLRDKAGGNFVLPMDCTVAGNVIDVMLTTAQSRNLPASGVWDLKLTYPSGDVATVLAGPFSVHAHAVDPARKLGAVK